MPQYYPIVVQAGRSLAGDSLGFHAYSLRLDNCTNQWMLEETSMAYVPPYSLGMCLRLYGTGVAILLNQAPIGQPQLAPIVGEQVIGVYSDQLRTEVAASPIRQFTLVQSVSDLTQGPEPALPPVGVDRLYADALGNIHHLHSDGTDLTLFDSSNISPTIAGFPLGGDLAGTINNGRIQVRYGDTVSFYDSGNTLRSGFLVTAGDLTALAAGGTRFTWVNQANSLEWMDLTATALTVQGGLTVAGSPITLPAGSIPTASIAPNGITQILTANGVTSGPTTASTTFVDMPDMVITGTFNGGQVLLWVYATVGNATAGAYVQVAISLDGGADTLMTLITSSTANALGVAAVFANLGAQSGSHTIKVRWCTFGGGTAQANGTFRRMLVEEVKR